MFLWSPALLLSELWRTHPEYTIGITKLALINVVQYLRSLKNRPTNYALSPSLYLAQPPGGLHSHQLKLLNGWLESKRDGRERHCKNIDWRATSLIKETLGLWFWGAHSTNFPNQPDILALLCEVPWESTKGFVFITGETSIAGSTRSVLHLDFWGWKIHPDTQRLRLLFLKTWQAHARENGSISNFS